MDTSKEELKFGFFENLDPEDHKLIVSVLKSGSDRVKLYWETTPNQVNSKSTCAGAVSETGKLTGSGTSDVANEDVSGSGVPPPDQQNLRAASGTPPRPVLSPIPQTDVHDEPEGQAAQGDSGQGQQGWHGRTDGVPAEGANGPNDADVKFSFTRDQLGPAENQAEPLHQQQQEPPQHQQQQPSQVQQQSQQQQEQQKIHQQHEHDSQHQNQAHQQQPQHHHINQQQRVEQEYPPAGHQQEPVAPYQQKQHQVQAPPPHLGDRQPRAQPHQPPPPHQHHPTPDQRVQAQTAAGLFENYFPPPPPMTDYVPPPPPGQVNVPAHRDKGGNIPQNRPPHVDPNYGMVQSWSENDLVRGQVSDGVYSRPGSGPSGQNVAVSASATGVKVYERRNKKRRPVDYYTRQENQQQDQPQIQNSGNPTTFHRMASVSVRQAMDIPSSTNFMGMQGSQQASVMSSQFNQPMQANYANMINATLMQPLAAMHILQQQQLLQQQHQQRHQHHQNPVQQQPFLAAATQQDLTRMALGVSAGYQPHYGHMQHTPQSPLFHTPPVVSAAAGGNHPNLRGLNQTSPVRPMPLSPASLTTSHVSPMNTVGRSPPRSAAVPVQQYPDVRPLEQHLGFQPHQPPQASPTVPPHAMPQVALTSPVNSANTFHMSSANQVHKEVPRTGGLRMPMMESEPPQPAAVSSFIGPPLLQQQQQPQLVNKPLVMSVPPQTGPQGPPPQAQINAHTTSQAPPQVAPQVQPQTSGSGHQAPNVDPPKTNDIGPRDDTPPVAQSDEGKPEGKGEIAAQSELMPPVADAPTKPSHSKVSVEQEPIVQADIKLPASDKNKDSSCVKTSEVKLVDTNVADNRNTVSLDRNNTASNKPPFTLTFGSFENIDNVKELPVSEDINQTVPDLSQDGPVTKEDNSVLPPQTGPSIKPVATSPTPSAPQVTATSEPTSVTTKTAEPAVTQNEVPIEAPKVDNSPVAKDRPAAVVAQVLPETGSGDIKKSQTADTVSEPPKQEAKPVSSAPAWGPAPTPAWGGSTGSSAPAWGKPKAWAAHFDRGHSASGEPQTLSVPDNHASQTRKSEEKDDTKELKKPVATAEDDRAKAFGEFLLGYTVKYTSVSLQPRGLYNRSNWCYINAVVQALLACPAFYQILKAMPLYKSGTRGSTSTPVMDCMVQFVNEFSEMPASQLKYIEKSSGKGPVRSNMDVRYGQPFEPVNILKMLQVIQYNTSFKHGRQEDAEEFMTCILNALHDEMVACMNATRPDNLPAEEKAKENGEVRVNNSNNSAAAVHNDDEDDQWEQVGPKNKSVVTRSAKLSQSPISEVFGGQMRSIFHTQGQKESATLQPFFTLQLDVQSEKVRNLQDALEMQSSKEIIHGYTDATTKQEVEASRRLVIDKLPPVLIMHIKCFVYNKTGGAQKVMKPFDYPISLTISKELISSNARAKYPVAKRNYELTAVVYHHGNRAIGGHYTADVFHAGLQCWIRLDDSNVRVVAVEKVLQFDPPRFPYLLYYRRKDLI